MTWVWPAGLYTLTIPLGGTLTITRFGTVWPGTKFRFEAFGGGASDG